MGGIAFESSVSSFLDKRLQFLGTLWRGSHGTDRRFAGDTVVRGPDAIGANLLKIKGEGKSNQDVK